MISGAIALQLLKRFGPALLVIAAIAACSAWLWHSGVQHGRDQVQAAWDAEKAAQVLAADKLAKQQHIDSSTVENRYADRIERVEVPVDRVVTRIIRSACRLPDAGVAGNGGLPVPPGDPGQPADAAAPADPDAGLARGIAEDIKPAELNFIQLEELQAEIRANTGRRE